MLKMKRFILTFLIVILGLGFAFNDPANGRDYVVGESDVLQITVYDHEDLTSTVRISREGTISFPLLGKVKVLGLTLGQIEDKLAKLLADGYIINPQVSVFIEDFRSRVFYVTGEVQKPDAYKYEDDTTVIKAITIAGGFTGLAAKGGVKIIRKSGTKDEILEKVRMDETVLPNDVIVVPESFF